MKNEFTKEIKIHPAFDKTCQAAILAMQM